MTTGRDLSSYETGSHDSFARDWSPARGSVAFVEGVREHESARDASGPWGW